jgi:hypothetical protein
MGYSAMWGVYAAAIVGSILLMRRLRDEVD